MKVLGVPSGAVHANDHYVDELKFAKNNLD
jgi:hypothetical protein